MNETIKITKLCPKCGMHRENAFENYQNRDPYALNLLRSCPECLQWLEKKSQSNPAIGTAKAGIINALQDLEHGKITIPMFHEAIRAILEALVEDVRANLDTERKVRP